jgi:hypothetical protein
MNYKDYIDLGFERIDTHDVVEFERTGSDGFVLMKKLNKNTSIEVCSGSLNKPKLYIDKKGENQHYSIGLNTYQVKQLLGVKEDSEKVTVFCECDDYKYDF